MQCAVATQHCLYYRLNYRQIQHSPGVGYPSSSKPPKNNNKTRKNIKRKKKLKFKQYKASRARIHRSGHSEARKNLTKLAAGNLGRNQSRLRLPGPPTGPRVVNAANSNTMCTIQTCIGNKRRNAGLKTSISRGITYP